MMEHSNPFDGKTLRTFEGQLRDAHNCRLATVAELASRLIAGCVSARRSRCTRIETARRPCDDSSNQGDHPAECSSHHQRHHGICDLELSALRGLRPADTVEREYASVAADRASRLRMDQHGRILTRTGLGCSVGRLSGRRVRLDLQHAASLDREQGNLMNRELMHSPVQLGLAGQIAGPMQACMGGLNGRRFPAPNPWSPSMMRWGAAR
jgi:hypothetical protein